MTVYTYPNTEEWAGRVGWLRVPGVGNGQPFVAVNIDRSEGDLRYVEYRQSLGCCKAIIFND